jgi:hypothetical protein
MFIRHDPATPIRTGNGRNRSTLAFSAEPCTSHRIASTWCSSIGDYKRLDWTIRLGDTTICHLIVKPWLPNLASGPATCLAMAAPVCTERTQEFVLRWSPDGGRSFREIVRQ